MKPKIKRKRVGRRYCYYLFHKIGDSIIYNDWYFINGTDTSPGLVDLDECVVSRQTLSHRLSTSFRTERKNNNHWTLLECLTKPTEVMIRTEGGFRERDKFIDILNLFKPGSLSCTST